MNLRLIKYLLVQNLLSILNLKQGDTLSLMSSTFIATPLGSLPKQENFKIAGIFNTGFLEFDQNIVFLNIEDALSIFNEESRNQNLDIFKRSVRGKFL